MRWCVCEWHRLWCGGAYFVCVVGVVEVVDCAGASGLAERIRMQVALSVSE